MMICSKSSGRPVDSAWRSVVGVEVHFAKPVVNEPLRIVRDFVGIPLLIAVAAVMWNRDPELL
jgi:hypothetical protein